MGYCMMATGDAKWADIIERSIFNALPGAVTKDFKQFQYFSCANQILATSTSSHNTLTRMSYRAAHDTECCGGNVNRAMPNYVIRQWMKLPVTSPRPGLAAVFYGPSEVTTEINGQPVTITQTTDYPFRDTITFKVQTKRPILFDLTLRIPGWCKSAKLTVNKKPYPGDVRSRHLRHHLPPLQAQRRHPTHTTHGTPHRRLVSTAKASSSRAARWSTRWTSRRSASNSPKTSRASRRTSTAILSRASPPSSSRLHPSGVTASTSQPRPTSRTSKSFESPMSANPFIPGQAPVHLELPLRHLPKWKPDWTAEPAASADGETADITTPAKLPSKKELRDADAATTQRLVPYGSTHIRLTTLPLVSSDRA